MTEALVAVSLASIVRAEGDRPSSIGSYLISGMFLLTLATQ